VTGRPVGAKEEPLVGTRGYVEIFSGNWLEPEMVCGEDRVC
jgi:hypothetical protein